MPTELLLDGFSCVKDCNYFKQCRRLCAPVAYMVAKVEYEPQQEKQLQEDQTRVYPETWPDLEQCTGTRALKKYFILRERPQEIAKELEVSTSYVYRLIRNGKKIIAENISKKVHSQPYSKVDSSGRVLGARLPKR